MKLISSLAVLTVLLQSSQDGVQALAPTVTKDIKAEPVIVKRWDCHRLRTKLGKSKTFDDDLINDLLISKRPGVHHLLYDEVIDLMQQLANNFPEILTLESVGKTFDNRDIWMMNIDGTKMLGNTNPDPKAILMVGAHHARELVSVQMPLYSVLDLMQGWVNKDAERMELLKRNKYFVIPFLNTDGSFTIYD